MRQPDTPCPLCQGDGGAPVWRGARVRVIRADEPGFPAFYRVILNRHVAEFSDLDAAQRQHCMDVVCAVEQILRNSLHPDKINLASLGNVVPHLHWHVIARFAGDSHFPDPVWATPRRQPPEALLRKLQHALPQTDVRMAQRLQAFFPQ